MKRKNSLLALLLLISAFSFFSFMADDDPLTKFLENFEQYFTENTQEKVYLQTDKPFYAVGDDIWFKAYVVDAKTLKPSPKSNILYVDLIDAKDSVKRTLRLPLIAGLGWGNFELKDSIKEGNYRLRAYTRWMRNFDQAFFYDKTFKIGNAWTSQLLTSANYTFSKDGTNENVVSNINYSNLDGLPYANKEVTYNVMLANRTITKGKTKTDAKGNITLDFSNNRPFLGSQGRINTSIEIAEGTTVDKAIPIVSTSNHVDVQFFPEGGDLIQDVRSRVAFKAVGTDGLGKTISGYVQDNTGQKVALIDTKHLGMGYFSMQPLPGKTYEAVVKFDDGSEKKFGIPAAKMEGAALSVNSLLGDSILIKVAMNSAFLEKNLNKEFTVIAQNSGSIIYTAKSKLNSLAFAAKLDKSRFFSGINQLTLFDDKLRPVAERLIFIAPKDTLAVSLNSDKSTYMQRGKTKFTMQALSPSGNPVIGSFSMAVVDGDKVNINADEEESIFSNIFLTSDIKGYVEDPNYYFTAIDDEKRAAADVLMLTQGWRRFAWNELSSRKNIVYPPERTLSISGKLTQGKDKPVENGTVTIFSSGKSGLLLQTKTDALGEFKVDSMYFADSTKFVIQGRTDKGRKNVDIQLYNSTLPIVTNNPNPSDLTVNINNSMMAYLKNSRSQYEDWLKNGIVNRSILLGEVVVVDKKPEVQTSSNLNGAGNADKVLTEKDLENSFSIEQALQGRVAGLVINNGIAYIRGSQAQIIMDGIYVEPEFLSSIPVQDVESIEILKTIGYTAIYGSRGGGGVIVINTKRGKPGYVSNVYVPGVMVYQPIGFYTPKEFYVPNYADPKLNTNVADLRTTIYWNPNIITDSLGRAEVSFYNGDNTGNYRVILEGTDLNGHLARKVVNYKVIAKN